MNQHYVDRISLEYLVVVYEGACSKAYSAAYIVFHGIVHRMSKVVVLLHFADPSFFPCRPRPPKKLTWGEMKKKARQTVGAIFLPPEWCMRRSADAAPPPYS